MGEADPLFLHLHKIPPSTSEETLDHLLQTLWKTRRVGLGSTLKPEIQTLLALPTLQHLDPVLACLRSLVRKCADGKLGADDIRKLMPADLSVDLQNLILVVILRHQNQWRDEASRDQPSWQRTRVSHQIKVNAHASMPTSELLTSLWPRQGSATNDPSNSTFGGPVASFADPKLSCTGPTLIHQDNSSSADMATIPRLKSMTWTMENRNLPPENRVAVITLKLQDYTKSPSGETEVKFKLSKDTLEAMLRSMASISEQLTNTVVPPSEPLLKRPRQQ